MLTHHKRLLAATGAAAAIAVTGVTAATATPHSQPRVSGTEHVQVMSTSTTSTTASAIAYGVFTAAGAADLGSGTITFPGGTVKLSHHAGTGTRHFSPKTCLTMISQPGTYKIISGTGKYAGISGNGTYQLSFTFIGSRTKGKCSTTAPPVAQQQLLRLSGPVQL